MENEKVSNTEQASNESDDNRVIVQIEVTPAEGGALLRMGGGGPKGNLPSKSRVVEGDPTSDSFRRKVQRTVIGWVKKHYFTAPPRAKKAETAATPA